jgi:hypothetical protein
MRHRGARKIPNQSYRELRQNLKVRHVSRKLRPKRKIPEAAEVIRVPNRSLQMLPGCSDLAEANAVRKVLSQRQDLEKLRKDNRNLANAGRRTQEEVAVSMVPSQSPYIMRIQ